MIAAIALACAWGGGPAMLEEGPGESPAVLGEMVEFPGADGPIKGYLAKPEGEGPFRAILLIHEWWGLTDWVKGNADRFAADGYVALAIDLYDGKATDDPGEAHELMRALDTAEAVGDLKGGVAYLQGLPEVENGKSLAAIGWCMGGGYAREIAQAAPEVGPVVICYGSVTTDPAGLAKLKDNTILGIFGAKDRGIPAAKVEDFGKSLEAEGAKVDMNIYEDSGHAFMRPGGDQYVEADADDAWGKIKAFFAENLKKD